MYLLHLTFATLLFVKITAKFDTRIIGGANVSSGEFPYAAAIHVQTGDSKFFCGGTLVRFRWILTSGHCVHNATLLIIQLGSTTLTETDSNRITLASSEYVLHPDFDLETIGADIGLIKLRMSVSESDYIKSAYFSTFIIKEEEIVRTYGWGQTSDFKPEFSEHLQYVEVVTLTNEECKLIYGNQISDNMICAGGNYNQGTCTGDNGGPLLRKTGTQYFIVGVASFISANGCESTDPSGFTRILPYYEWIISVIDYNKK